MSRPPQPFPASSADDRRIAALTERYEPRYAILREMEDGLRDYVERLVSSNQRRVDQIRVRSKRPESFVRKAELCDSSGKRKYADPLSEIRDQLGTRVVVYFLGDVNLVEVAVRQILPGVTFTHREPPLDAFGYWGSHAEVPIPANLLTSGADILPVFEFQITTLFQHAWATAEHDLTYKPARPLTPDDLRLAALASAHARSSDLLFRQIKSPVAIGLLGLADGIRSGRIDAELLRHVTDDESLAALFNYEPGDGSDEGAA